MLHASGVWAIEAMLHASDAAGYSSLDLSSDAFASVHLVLVASSFGVVWRFFC